MEQQFPDGLTAIAGLANKTANIAEAVNDFITAHPEYFPVIEGLKALLRSHNYKGSVPPAAEVPSLLLEALAAQYKALHPGYDKE